MAREVARLTQQSTMDGHRPTRPGQSLWARIRVTGEGRRALVCRSNRESYLHSRHVRWPNARTDATVRLLASQTGGVMPLIWSCVSCDRDYKNSQQHAGRVSGFIGGVNDLLHNSDARKGGVGKQTLLEECGAYQYENDRTDT